MSLVVGCGATTAPVESTQVSQQASVSPTSGLAAESSQHDHALEEEDAGARLEAAERVSWQAATVSGKTVAVRLLGFNDFHGQLTEGRSVGGRPVGGAAVLASYLEAASANYKGRSLIIHAGDLVGATPPQSALLQDEPTIQFVNTLCNSYCNGQQDPDSRCNVVGTLGNHEFDEGQVELLRMLNGGNHATGPFLQNPYVGARYPYVSANVVTTLPSGKTKPFIRPYVIRKLNDVKVGVIGAVLQATPTIVTPTGVAGLTFLSEASAINAQVAELKSKGIRTIVVTIHQGAAQSPSYTTDTDPAALVGAPISSIVSQLDDEVDVVISGHSHTFSNALVKTTTGHDILVTQAFSASTAYSEIDMTVDKLSGDVVFKTARIVTTYSDQAPGSTRNAAAQAIVNQAVAVTAPLVNRPIATFTASITTTQSAAGESDLGNLIADSQRAAMQTDFAFMNPGGIRTNLTYAANPAQTGDADGLALWGELFAIQPFGNSLVRLNMTGAQILALLEQQFVVNRMLQISGLTYTWDNAAPVGSKVVSVLQNGSPIDPLATYSVTANNFIVAGGDGFTVFTSGTGNVGGPIDLDALIAYVQALPQPFSAPASGRITRLN